MAEVMQKRCLYCGTWNQFPEARLADGPRCGECKLPLVAGPPAALDDAGFAAELARNDGTLIVDFWATWCGPCRAFGPVFRQAAADYGVRVRFATIDVDNVSETTRRYNVGSIPTMMAFRDGREVDRVVGGLTGAQLDRWVRGVAGLPPLPDKPRPRPPRPGH